jgi:hypothetical protein
LRGNLHGRKFYGKNELTFAIVWIVIYCVLQSLANPLNEKIGIEYSANAVFGILQTIILLSLIWKNDLLEQYGFCKIFVPARRFLYYVPLIMIATGNLWNGVAVSYSLLDMVCHIVCMLCVRFALRLQ